MAAERRTMRGSGLVWVGLLLGGFVFFWWLVEAQWTTSMTMMTVLSFFLLAGGISLVHEAVVRFLATYWLALYFVAAVAFVLAAPASWIESLRVSSRMPGWLVHVLVLFVLEGLGAVAYVATRRKGELSAERGAGAANVVFLLQVGVGLLVLVNVIATGWLTSAIGSLDTTETRIYTLGDRTRGILDGLRDLPGDIQATYLDFGSNYRAMPGEEPLGDQGKDYLRQYSDYAPKLKVTVLDAVRDKRKVEEHFRELGIEERDLGTEDTVVFTYRLPGDRRPKRKDVTVSRWTFMETSQLGTRKFTGEQRYTSAIQDVIYPKKKVYFLKGHGEHSLRGTGQVNLGEAGETIRRLALDTDELSLADRGAVPEDADLVVIAGPRSPLMPKEREALLAWLDGGGSLILMMDPQAELLSEGGSLMRFGLEDWLSDLGVEVKPDHVCVDYDVTRGARGGGAVLRTTVVLTSDYGGHPTVRDLDQSGLPCRFLEASPVLVKDGARPEGVTVEELVYMRRAPEELHNAPTTYAAKLYPGRNPEREDPDNDIRNQRLPIGVALQRKAPGSGEGKATRVVVFGDSEFATSLGLLERSAWFAPGHGSLLANAVSWAVEREELISIEPKTLETEKVALTEREGRLAKVVGLFALPVLVLLFGIYVAFSRRR